VIALADTTDSAPRDAEPSRYDDIENIGELYDAVPVYQGRRDVPFYVEESLAGGGEVLEIGCGTGRVLIPVARAGAKITGIDQSERMLERCRANMSSESEEVVSHISLDVGDMREFDLGRTFATVIIPFRPLQHLVSAKEQIAAFTAIARHLSPNGRLVFDVFNPDFRLLVDPTRLAEREDTPRTTLADGRTLRRTGRTAAVHFVEQWSEVELIYYVQHVDGRTERLVHTFPMRWYTKAELDHLLARCGFRTVQTYGDFDRSPLSDESREMIFVAKRI